LSSDLHEFATALSRIYGDSREAIAVQVERYGRLMKRFDDLFPGAGDRHLFSTPGRIEIGGNHTDHNHGRVLAASIDLDAIAVAARSTTSRVIIFSEGYPDPFDVNLDRLGIVEEEKGKTHALIRGIAAGLEKRGCDTGGFSACIGSEVRQGSGLSSSAVIEVLIATIFNALYNGGGMANEELAKVCQAAENEYFGKPCGLMDQMTCAIGGIVAIDFRDLHAPRVERVDFRLEREDYRALILDTGGSHAGLTEEYASIPMEMKSVARVLGGEVCRDISRDDVVKQMRRLRREVGDRAVLRALHFIEENERVHAQVRSLRQGDFGRFLALIQESGNSSFKWLQNVYPAGAATEQRLAMALHLTERFVSQVAAGACRIHGGGFAGTILVFLPSDRVVEYAAFMASVFGPDSVRSLHIRPRGTTHLNSMAKEI